MKRKTITTFILSTLLFIAYSQKNDDDKNELSELEKEIELYIIEKFNCKYHTSIEFQKKKPFNLNQIIANHKVPTILKDDVRAIEDNEEAFNWLENISNEYIITYTMNYIFGTKDKELEDWNPYWVMLLLDNQSDIIGHIRYFP